MLDGRATPSSLTSSTIAAERCVPGRPPAASAAPRSARAGGGAQVGVVEYKNRDDVYEALRTLDGAILHDRRVRIVEVHRRCRLALAPSFGILLRRR